MANFLTSSNGSELKLSALLGDPTRIMDKSIKWVKIVINNFLKRKIRILYNEITVIILTKSYTDRCLINSPIYDNKPKKFQI